MTAELEIQGANDPMANRARREFGISGIASMIVLGAGLAGLRAMAGWRLELARHRAVMKSALGSSLFLDTSLHVTAVGKPLAAIFAMPCDTMIGQPIERFISDGRHTFEEMASRPDISGHPHYVKRLAGQRPDGTKFEIEITAVPLYGTVAGWFVVITGVDETLRLERMKSDFVATVSHELRTPLSSIAGALGLVEAGYTGPLSDDTAEMVGVALNNTKRLIVLINDLLDIERIESGKLHFDLKTHSLGVIVQTAIDDIRPFADEHGIRIDSAVDTGDDHVCVDGNRALQVFNNLLSNAIKFSPRDGTIRIQIQAGPIYHKVNVLDNGPGIPEKFRSRLYEKFAQADGSSSRRVSGTGLGLAICREIVGRLDGKLRFAPNPEGGSIFTVELPADRSRDVRSQTKCDPPT